MDRRRKPVARRKHVPANAPSGKTTAKTTVAKAITAGAPSADTSLLVVYVHGIGNKPRESVLRCQWDSALFGVNMGDRTRMAYWVNRDRYPLPEPGDCAGADRVEPLSTEVRGLALRPDFDFTAATFKDDIAALGRSKAEREALNAIATRMAEPRRDAKGEAPLVSAREVREKVLPLPEPARRMISRLLTGMFLKDVRDFLFVEDERDRMCGVLEQRLTAGAGPFIVVAHSQGTMVAYKTLFDLGKRRPDLNVPLLVTMGSPLGMQEVVDRMRVFTGVRKGALPKPGCVDRWINIADRFDPVAVDNQLHGDYVIPDHERNERTGFAVNGDWQRDPHSATGYLSNGFVRDAVWDTIGPSFAQSVRSFVVARDLHADISDAPEERHPVLIELKGLGAGGLADGAAETSTIAARGRALADHIHRLHRKGNVSEEAGGVEVLRRFVAARLNRLEVEALQAGFKDLHISRVWRNGVKRALISESVKTIQASTAQLGYGALGRDIGWAVLDTGVAAGHPHFNDHQKSVVSEWDCTGRGELKEPAAGDHPAADGDGHGTHVCGIIAGRFPKQLPSREYPELPPTAFTGMAPEAKLHVYKVLNDQGVGQDSWIIKALDHIAHVNESAGALVIHGVNLSLGSSFDPEVYGCGHTPLCEELRRLWRQGVLVCVSAGNEGYAVLRSTEGNVEANMDLSIGDPANLDDCIAVGSVHKVNPHTYGVSYFSSRGPTADGRRKPDVVAPGERVLSASHRFPNELSEGRTAEDYFVEMGGTSMACPHVSGILAAFLSVRREFIGYPDRVKQILLANCTDLGRDPYIQGYGMPNLTKMLLNT